MTADVMTAYAWRSNAHMIADLRRILAFPNGPWCDLTYGQGKWWPRAVNPAPEGMVRCVGPHTVDPAPHDVVCDFRDTPFRNNRFECVWYDPPYVLKGTDAQFAGMNAAYGIDSATMRARGAGHRATDYAHVKERDITGYLTRHGWEQRTQSRWATGWFKGDHSVTVPRQSHAGDYPSHVAACFAQIASATGVGADDLAAAIRPPTRKQALEQLIIDGLTEAVRITRPGGWIAAKAGRGIDGGRLFSTDDLMVRTGWALGLTEVASTWLLTTPRSQEHNGPQRSPRANTSRLTIFEVPT